MMKTVRFSALLYKIFILDKTHAVKAVAPEIDVSPSTLYDYIEGRLTFPPDKISLLYKATGDRSILDFFLMDTDYVLYEKPEEYAKKENVISIQGLSLAERTGLVVGEIKKALEDGVITKEERSSIIDTIQPLIRAAVTLEKGLK